MQIQRVLILLYAVIAVVVGGETTSFAQVAKTSTESEDLQRLMDKLRNPGKAENRLRQNPNLQGKDILTKPLEEMKIEKRPVLKRSLRDLKRGGVHSGGGDEIGMEFVAALREAIFDFALVNYDENENFPWFDLAPYALSLNFVAQDTPIQVDGETPVRVAVNDVAAKTIILQRGIWSSIRDRRIRSLIALNQVILMQQNKATGFAQQAIVSAQGQGISALSLSDGKEHELNEKEKTETANHQCLWSYKSLQRVAKQLLSDSQLCFIDSKLPEQFQLRLMHTEQLLERCETTCGFTSESRILAQRCRDYLPEKSEIVRVMKRVAPKCVGAGQ